jgi:hypothetical protein
MLVIGQRLKNGTKEYLLRNSWGPGCETIHHGLECDDETGQIWIPIAKLTSYTTNVAWLSKRKTDYSEPLPKVYFWKDNQPWNK